MNTQRSLVGSNVNMCGIGRVFISGNSGGEGYHAARVLTHRISRSLTLFIERWDALVLYGAQGRCFRAFVTGLYENSVREVLGS